MPPDISDQPRRFVVWIDKQVPKVRAIESVIVVQAGEDAEARCKDHLDEMIGSELDTGWRQEDE